MFTKGSSVILVEQRNVNYGFAKMYEVISKYIVLGRTGNVIDTVYAERGLVVLNTCLRCITIVR